MVCPQCGRALSSEAIRCRSCGAFVATSVVTADPSADTTGLPTGATFEPTTAGSSKTADSGAGETAAETVDGVRRVRPRAGSLEVGQAFGTRYRILKLLGIGGMGAVYQAWDAELGVAVALKVIRPDARGISPDLEKRFKNELLLARQVTHKHVVRIHDLGEIGRIKYITMPYVEGRNLEAILREQGKLALASALRYGRQIASGLQAAHEAGVIHRDLKPANIMIGADDQALIMDFGISASAADAESGGVVGTFEFMAPEQGEGRAVDGRADIYAFGLILYEMLLGPRRTASRTAQERLEDMRRRFDQGMPTPRLVDESIRQPLDALIARCLARDPADRFQTSADLVAALNRIDDTGALIPEPRRLTPRLMAAAALVLVTLAGATYFVGRRAAPVVVQHEQMPVLIADFVNRSGDPVFEGSIEQTLQLALEQAPYVSVLPTKEARAIATGLAPDKSDRITREIGQLIATREGLKVLLTGAIDRQSAGFRLRVDALDPATGKAIATVSRDVSDKSMVLGTVASMAATVREAFGESKTEMAKVAAAETFTAASLEASRAYTAAQDLLDRAKYPEAIPAYQEALRLDPRMGRAYAGMAVAYRNLKQSDNAKRAYDEAIKLTERMTDREKYRTLGGYYFTVVHNYEKAVENYETLFRLFPADKVGLANLAFAHLMTGNVQRALLFGKQAADADPKSTFIRYNYAMYAMYAGEFDTGKAQAPILLKNDPTFHLAWLPFAQSALALGDAAAARDAYAKMAAIGDAGRSLASVGEADNDMYLGRYKDAVTALRSGIAFDEGKKDAGNAAHKYVALSEAYFALGQKKAAADAADKASSLSRDEGVLFPAAGILIRTGRPERSEMIASALANMLQTQTTSDSDLIRGEIALEHKDLAGALERFRTAQKRHDSWFSHFLLGAAYAAAEHFSEALTEFETCVKRRGEATDAFFADTPTLRYLPPAYYWLARSQEAVGVKAGAKSNYEQFLRIRSAAEPPDPLAADARTRLALLQ